MVGTIAYHADIPGSLIGKIRIQDNHTVVDVPEQFVAQVLAKASDFRIHREIVIHRTGLMPATQLCMAPRKRGAFLLRFELQ